MVKLICRRCHKSSGTVREANGAFLCTKCFLAFIEKRVETTIERHHFIKLGDRVLVALSGGKDSVCLLHILKKISEGIKIDLQAITVDEGIQGYRRPSLEVAVENCRKLGIEHHVLAFKTLFGYTMDDVVAIKKNRTPCAVCGLLRRRALNLGALKINANKLATGHNLDDEAQTFIMNIIDGNPVKSVNSQHKSPATHSLLVPRVKPLHLITQRQIAMYVYFKELAYFGSIVCPYAAFGMREKVMKILNRLEVDHPDVKHKISKSLRRIQSGWRTYASNRNLVRCDVCGQVSSSNYCEVCRLLKELDRLSARNSCTWMAKNG